MKRKNLLYGFLTAALLINSIVRPAPEARAAQPDLESGLTAYYTFDDSTLNNSMGDQKAAKVVGQRLASSDKTAVYEEGKNGMSVRLGDYGLRLDQKNLGENFTVSMWLKPDGTFAENQVALFLGSDNAPNENWVAVSGNDRTPSAICKVWRNVGPGWNHTTYNTVEIGSGAWHFLALTGTEQTITAYLDGVQVASGESFQPMAGENQNVCIGANHWEDALFAGLVDEVRVYNRTLSSEEIRVLCAQDLLDETSVSDLKIPAGRSQTVPVMLPEAVKEAGAVLRYESSAPEVASVDEDGQVTALTEGKAEITVTIVLNGKEITRKASVTVLGTLEAGLKAYYNFEGNLANQAGTGSAEALVTDAGGQKMNPYTGTVAYEDGKEGRAVSLGDYGLLLDSEALGDEYTVSFWMKSRNTLTANQCVLLLGSQAPERWMALSGDRADKTKFWGNGGVFASHTTLLAPKIQAGEWYQMTLCGKRGEISVYLNGISLGTVKSNDPLGTDGSGIYLGVNRWDDEFTGLMDEVKVYDIALSEEEVQAQMGEEYDGWLQKRMDKEVSLRPVKLLADNRNAQEVKYDLKLPKEIFGLPIVWSSSNEAVLNTDGIVTTPAEDTEVTLTASAASGRFHASRTYTFMVRALDRKTLDQLLEKAASVDREHLLKVSRDRLDQAIAEAEEADSFASVDQAADRLRQALERLCYEEDYESPFWHVVSPAVRTSMKVGEEEQVFELPEKIMDAVDVKYFSEKPEIASYTDGRITGLSEGKTVVTAVVTSRYDQWEMEYSTAVLVEKKDSDKPTGGDDKPTGGDDKPTGGDDNPAGGDNKPAEDDKKPSSGGAGKHKPDRGGSSGAAAPAPVSAEALIQAAAEAGGAIPYGRGTVDVLASEQQLEASDPSLPMADAGIVKNEAPKEPDVPKVFRDVEDESVPQATVTRSWALVNLLALLLTVAAGLWGLFRKSGEDKKVTVKAAGIIIAVLAAATFFLTENLGSNMEIVDGWTLLMILYAAVNGVLLKLDEIKNIMKTDE